jgi:hypothetical protein
MKNTTSEASSFYFPSLKEVQEGIKEIRNEKWEKYILGSDLKLHLESVRKKITKHLFVIPHILSIYDNEPKSKLPLFRARPRDQFNNMHLSCEYSYPPIKSCTEIQRVNLPHHPVFYASRHPATALVEIIKNNHYENPNREYCISRWEMTSQKGLKVAPFLFGESNSKLIHDFAKKLLEQKIPDIFKDEELSNDKIEAVKQLLMFYNNMFLNDSDYSVSSYMGHSHLYAPHNYSADILIYPSIQLKSDALNYAIHPNIVDERMHIKRVYIVKVNNINLKTSEYNFTVTKYAEIDNGFFDWHEMEPNDEKYKEFERIDFGENINSVFTPRIKKQENEGG